MRVSCRTKSVPAAIAHGLTQKHSFAQVFNEVCDNELRINPQSLQTQFIARPGRDRQRVIRDPQGEPRLIFGEDDGTRINDRLARYIVESLNAGLNPEDPNPDEGWFLDSPGDSDEQDPAILICDPDFEIRLEIPIRASLKRIRRSAERL